MRLPRWGFFKYTTVRRGDELVVETTVRRWHPGWWWFVVRTVVAVLWKRSLQ